RSRSLPPLLGGRRRAEREDRVDHRLLRGGDRTRWSPPAPCTATCGTGDGGALDFMATCQERVKVGLRVRPAFRDEVERCVHGPLRGYVPVIEVHHDGIGGDTSSGKDGRAYRGAGRGQGRGGGGETLAEVELCLSDGRRRTFGFDLAFRASCGQEEVYERLAQPIVEGVLAGYGGLVMAYGQTGTGKTYTMGILESLPG
ncbi:unnamed protein product, partial [Discosporangium mesarthrocarpum]